jgi:hypothetical protein
MAILLMESACGMQRWGECGYQRRLLGAKQLLVASRIRAWNATGLEKDRCEDAGCHGDGVEE